VTAQPVEAAAAGRVAVATQHQRTGGTSGQQCVVMFHLISSDL
jgi:hypothetical protein